MRKALIIIFFSFIISASIANAGSISTPNVAPDSPLYRELDKLISFGLIEPPILGQRPYPRSEFARMTAEAIEKMKEREDKKHDDYDEFVADQKKYWQIKASLKNLKTEFEDELIDLGAIEGEKKKYRIHPFEKFDTYFTILDSPPVTIPPNNGRGTINALIDPLADYNLGRHYTDGVQIAHEVDARFTASRFLSGYVRPRFEINFPRDGYLDGDVHLQNAYSTFRAGNFSLEFGRDSMIWGFGERGSLLFSTNPRPMDGFWLTNPTPARLPWVFKYLGRWRYTLYAVNLGPGQAQKWPWLAGYKFSLSPSKYVEIGFAHAVEIGGEGAPTPSLVDVIGEYVGFRPAGTNPSAPNLTNHTFEIDYLLRIVPLRGLSLYGNIVIEDKWKSIKKTLKQGCSYLWGVYVPALNSSGTMDLRVEYVMTSPLQYHHSLYEDGYTLNRRIIGSDAGPDANAVHAIFRHTLSPNFWYGLTFDWDYRRSDTYTELRNPNDTAGPVVKVASGPTDERYRGMLDIDWKFRKNMTLHLTGGYERALNFNFIQGNDRNNYMLSASLGIDLDKFFAFVE